MRSSKRRPRTSRYNRRVFDPQRMYQHPITRRQAKGTVLQPKASNLVSQDPRIDQTLLQKYYETVRDYNMIPNSIIGFLSYNIPISEISSYEYNLTESNLRLFLRTADPNLDLNKVLAAFVTEVSFRKATDKNWPQINLTYHIGNITNSLTGYATGSDLGMGGNTASIEISPPYLRLANVDNFLLYYQRVYYWATKAVINNSFVSYSAATYPIVYEWVKDRNLYLGGFHSPEVNTMLPNDFVTTTIDFTTTETDSNRYMSLSFIILVKNT